jgi:hypothetical protein
VRSTPDWFHERIRYQDGDRLSFFFQRILLMIMMPSIAVSAAAGCSEMQHAEDLRKYS